MRQPKPVPDGANSLSKADVRVSAYVVLRVVDIWTKAQFDKLVAQDVRTDCALKKLDLSGDARPFTRNRAGACLKSVTTSFNGASLKSHQAAQAYGKYGHECPWT